MPVFRILGSDQVYAYDYRKMDYGKGSRWCPTLEPAQLGRDPSWCDRFLCETFGGNGLCFHYTQAGQENRFGRSKVGAGICRCDTTACEYRNLSVTDGAIYLNTKSNNEGKGIL